MGHMEHYEFVDFRVGEYGLSYCRASLAEITALADEIGYTGPITQKVKAFPQAPSDILKKRAESALRDLHGESTEDIPW